MKQTTRATASVPGTAPPLPVSPSQSRERRRTAIVSRSNPAPGAASGIAVTTSLGSAVAAADPYVATQGVLQERRIGCRHERRHHRGGGNQRHQYAVGRAPR